MKYDYDIITIGLGPAGMAVSVMGSNMGLKVLAVEKHKIGGECMNVGCIPSKALLRISKTRHIFEKLDTFKLEKVQKPQVHDIFTKIQDSLDYINEKKNKKMFDKVTYLSGDAHFVDSHKIKVGDKVYSAKRIFIAVGTKPAVIPIPGINDIDYLTNENIFKLDKVPKTMTVIGGGAIGTEMSQAYSRLGTKVTIVQMDEYLLPHGDPEAGRYLEVEFKKEKIKVLNGRKLIGVSKDPEGNIHLKTDKGEDIVSEKLLIAAGRNFKFDSLKLEKAGVKFRKRGDGPGKPPGIVVDKYLRTNKKHIYAVGDCNGHFLLSHAAMHQGMIAIMNTLLPWRLKRNFKKYVVPWTVFTDPQISYVGALESELKRAGKKYEVITTKYSDYGAAIAEHVDSGYVKAFISPAGKIYGVSIVGEGSGEMINEWALAIQQKISIFNIMMLQHSFPSMSFLNKRIGEEWMMGKMKIPLLRRFIKLMY